MKYFFFLLCNLFSKVQTQNDAIKKVIQSLFIAIVWCDYEFLIDSKLSHKGVDVFQLFYSDNGWKIIQICDTRRK